MLPRKHASNIRHEATATPVIAQRNPFELVCRKCFNNLQLSPSLKVCNYHGCRNRVPIQYVTKCPKGEF